MSASDRIVYIHEHFEFDRRGPIATGVFDCELRDADGELLGIYADPPLGYADALAWGRSRADRVSVRITGNGEYSAGRVAGADPPVDESAVFLRRRPPGWEFLDRTEDDPPILWDVIVDVGTRSASQIASDGRLTELGEHWLAALRSACEVIEVTKTGADGRIHTQTDGNLVWSSGLSTTRAAVVRLEARSWRAARQAAINAAAGAAEAAEWTPTPMVSAEHAFATGSHAAHKNARVGGDGIIF